METNVDRSKDKKKKEIHERLKERRKRKGKPESTVQIRENLGAPPGSDHNKPTILLTPAFFLWSVSSRGFWGGS